MRRQTHASGGARALRYPVHFPAVVPQFAHVDKILAFLKANTNQDSSYTSQSISYISTNSNSHLYLTKFIIFKFFS